MEDILVQFYSTEHWTLWLKYSGGQQTCVSTFFSVFQEKNNCIYKKKDRKININGSEVHSKF